MNKMEYGGTEKLKSLIILLSLFIEQNIYRFLPLSSEIFQATL